MTADEFLTIIAMREHCGLTSDDKDALLIQYRAAAINIIEQETSRNILDRENVTVEEYDRHGDAVHFHLPDSKLTGNLEVHYRPSDLPKGFKRTEHVDVADDYYVVSDARISVLPPPDSDGSSAWPDADPNVGFAITINVGIKAADCPDPFRTAALFLIREFLDGNMLNKIPDNIVTNMLMDYSTPPLLAGDVR